MVESGTLNPVAVSSNLAIPANLKKKKRDMQKPNAKQADPKRAANWDKSDRVVVRVIDTGVELVVARGYYEAYKNEGIVFLKDYVEPKPKAPPKRPIADKVDEDKKGD